MPTTPTILTAAAPPLDLIFERYIARLHNRGRKDATVINFTRAVVPFQAWLAEQGIAPVDVTVDDVESYFGPNGGVNGYAQGTRRMHAQQIRAAYAFASRRDWLTGKNPFEEVELPKAPDPEAKTLTSAQLRAMRDRCRNWRHEILWGLLVYTGMRKDEVRRLTWEDVDLAAMTMTFVGKGAKRRTVPIHPELMEIMERTPGLGNITEPSLRQGPVLWSERGHEFAEKGASFSQLLEPLLPAGVTGFHIFRKTAATSLFRNGVQGDTIDRIFGWAPAGVRARYYTDIKADDLHRAILMLYRDDPVTA